MLEVREKTQTVEQVREKFVFGANANYGESAQHRQKDLLSNLLTVKKQIKNTY